nr:3-oxoacyl-ACP synthase [Paludibacteraceae bacterium]
MIIRIADYIITPLGEGVERNLEALLRGECMLRHHTSIRGELVPEPFVGSLFDRLPEYPGYSPYEALCIAAAEPAIRCSGLDVSSSDVVFVLSTTKGNIWSSPADSARKVAGYFGNKTTPVVVSNACTTGVSAQLTAFRLLSAGTYRTAVLIGCDVQSLFIVSGFQSFKALSPDACRPFDADRKGLNAGEAAACLILGSLTSSNSPHPWCLLGGSIHNDANHISGPSRTAEGSLRCLQDALAVTCGERVACVSVHGTGTAYNDEMEALALHRAGLDDTPVSALKGYFGHTMGAAGLLETILTLHALDKGLILPVKGFEQQGTTSPVNVSPETRQAQGHTFIKLLSGFGGVNAAVTWSRDIQPNNEAENHWKQPVHVHTVNEIRITSETDLVAAFRALAQAYPKFFKMDTLCRLGFVATEQLLQGHADFIDPEHTALILANHSASLANDTEYLATISDPDNYYPSPALFVYTLPNIVTGELAIRHGLYGETAFYVLDNETTLQPIIDATLRDERIHSAIVGWVECTGKSDYEAHLSLVTKQSEK